MLLQTNSYVVPRERRQDHARLVRRFRQVLAKLGCTHFDVFEQVSQNWTGQDSSGRYVQIMRFRNRRHQLEVQAAERSDPDAQALIQEFCDLINFPFQQQQGLFAVGFYTSVLTRSPDQRSSEAEPVPADPSIPGAPASSPFASAETPSPDPSSNEPIAFGEAPGRSREAPETGSNQVPDPGASRDDADDLFDGPPNDPPLEPVSSSDPPTDHDIH